MAITKQTIVDRVEVTRDGVMNVRLTIEVLDDGEIIGRRYHRIVVTPVTALNALLATVNAHLISIKADPIVPAQVNWLKRATQAFFTPEVVAAYIAANPPVSNPPFTPP